MLLGEDICLEEVVDIFERFSGWSLCENGVSSVGLLLSVGGDMQLFFSSGHIFGETMGRRISGVVSG